MVAAQASQDRVPEKDRSQATSPTEGFRRDGDHPDAREGRSREAREHYRDERKEAHEQEEDEDRTNSLSPIVGVGTAAPALCGRHRRVGYQGQTGNGRSVVKPKQ
jgi:hypothetical protein